jgi:hypothetical protein
MQLVAPDILGDACGLSVGLAIVALLAGFVLWLFGWRSHRFWVVLGATVLAGVFGLIQGPALRAPTLPVAVLLALAAGLLALSLMRAAVFFTTGLAVVLLTQELWPDLHQPVLIFLGTGILCHFLFRLCLTALTAFGGAVLMVHAVLMLLHRYAHLEVTSWAERVPGAFNWICGVLALPGFVLQLYLHRRANRNKGGEDEKREWVLRIPRLWNWLGKGESEAA